MGLIEWALGCMDDIIYNDHLDEPQREQVRKLQEKHPHARVGDVWDVLSEKEHPGLLDNNRKDELIEILKRR